MPDPLCTAYLIYPYRNETEKRLDITLAFNVVENRHHCEAFLLDAATGQASQLFFHPGAFDHLNTVERKQAAVAFIHKQYNVSGLV